MAMMLKAVLGAAGGAAVGYAMYRFAGCRTGACPLNSNPYVAMATWGLLGALFVAGGR
jgi:hypothetical protein